MMDPHTELQAFMGFDEDYQWAGASKTDVTRMLGQAVVPSVADAIAERVFDVLAA